MPVRQNHSKPFSMAGQNVLLAYLLSEMLPSPFGLIHFDAQPGPAWYVFVGAAWEVSSG